MFDHWTRPVFDQHLNSPFQTTLADQSVALQLVQVTDLTTSPKLDTFSVHFRGPAAPFLAQGMYRLSHAEIGSADVFLVPIAREGDGFVYEAIFNRVRR